MLRETAYRHDVRVGQELAEAEHAVTATLLWHLRVLAGWQPREGAEAVRLLAAWFELANTVDHARALAGRQTGAPVSQTPTPPYRLGTLDIAWPRLASATSLSELRSELAASPWRDPGGTSPLVITVAMSLSWAQRVSAVLQAAEPWAAGAAALLIARERFVSGRELSEPAARQAAAVLGSAAVRAESWSEFVGALRETARWAAVGVDRQQDLWIAERQWWARVETDGLRLLHWHQFGLGALLGCVAVLATDAWRVRAALQIADRGGRGLEEFDALA